MKISNDGSRQTGLIDIDLAAVLRGDPAANVPLRPFDYLLIKETPNWTDQETGHVEGRSEVPRHLPNPSRRDAAPVAGPGWRTHAAGLSARQCLHPLELKEREQKQLDVLSGRLQSDLASMALKAAAANQAGASQAITSGQSLLGQLQAPRR